MNDLARLSSTLLLAVACVGIETVEQMLYRFAGRDDRRWWYYVTPAAVLHVAGLAVWYLLLRVAPLAVALPMLGMQYVSIAVAARFFFKERVGRRRWAAIVTITIGFTLIAVYSDASP